MNISNVIFRFLASVIALWIHSYYCGDITPVAFGKNNLNVMPAAFGDFNSDELTDMFVIRNKSTVEILLGSTTEPYFKQHDRMKCLFKTQLITSVVPGDFDGDALMDVLVTTWSTLTPNLTNVYILWGELYELKCASDENNPLFRMLDEPLAIDRDRNMTVDLFGINELGERGFWIFGKNRTSYEWKPMSSRVNYPLRKPHSHAFLDLNNDNSPDLYLTGMKNFEIWLWNNTISDFMFDREIDFPAAPDPGSFRIGQTLFMDVEIANKMDQIIPVCFEIDEKQNFCKNSTILTYSNDRWYNLNVDFKEKSAKLWGFPAPGLRYTETITLRGGDFNMDGYPDFLLTLIHREEYRSVLLQNVECKIKCEGFNRTFEIQWAAFGDSNRNTVMGTFYDFLQDGILDIIFVRKPTKSTNSDYNITAFKNSLDYDANFIKVMVITGLTNNEIKFPPTIVLGPKRQTFGTNLPGPKITYKTITQEGSLRIGLSTQLPQSGHFSLALPYTIFGLGRTPNFVEDLTVGMFNESRTWTQIIPNSQLIVIPYPTDSPWKWRAQLFVTPSKIILQTVIALLGTCLIILFIIAVLHWKERVEDKIEKLQEAHKFHFDAM